MAQLSPGVEVNEIDLSIIVPILGNATACFAGQFTKGPSDKYMLITNQEELIKHYGKPSNANYNDWFQCYSFLNYANSLLVSRAVDSEGTFSESGNTVNTVNEIGKVEVMNAPSVIQVGSLVKFGADSEDSYKVASIEAPVEAVAQVDTITIVSAFDGDYTLTINGTPVTYTADVSVAGDDTTVIATQLSTLINALVDGPVTVTDTSSNIITIQASVAGVEIVTSVDSGDMTVMNVTGNIPGETYELVFEDVDGSPFDFSTISGASYNDPVYIGTAATNASVDVPFDDTVPRTALETYPERVLIENEDQYEMLETSLPLNSNTKLKFMTKSSGTEMNGVEIAIALPSDFANSTPVEAFQGIILNDLFETAPSTGTNQIAVMIREEGIIVESYIVSLNETSKDFRNKSDYIENVINKYSEYVYVKVNEGLGATVSSRIYSTNGTLFTSNGVDGIIKVKDITKAYGNVSDNTIFGNKEFVDIDIVIANEQARVSASQLASDRKDCICFIGAKFEDVVGLASSKIVENLTKDVLTGELNNAYSATSYCAYFGNYKKVYDKYNDKMRWISVAGDVSGLRAQTNSNQNSWWASAGLERGQIKAAQKIAFNPNQGQRDMLYKNKVNPIVSFPGQGNAIVWGQKTLQAKPSSFDRINVRGLFNTLERAIARMAKNYLFEFNDVYTRNRFVATIKPFMEEVKAGRGVYDYYIRCDEMNNTSAVIDSNRFIADIAVKPTRVAEYISLNFIAVGTGVEFSEIFA